MDDYYIKQIHFHNTTELPVMIDSWVDGSNKFYSQRIGAGEKVLIHSSIGEWHIHSMFTDTEDRKLWVENGLGKYLLIGKFRSKPCASGNYAWMEWDDYFECIYSENESEDVKGLITFIYNPLE
jgi:hypothetical protein